MHHYLSSIVIIVFFFKQKTAYEMRISDWSSDVCSSDLGRGRSRPHGGARAERGPRRRIRPAATRPDDGGGPAGGDARRYGASLGRGEIGRASCRERVCQYV